MLCCRKYRWQDGWRDHWSCSAWINNPYFHSCGTCIAKFPIVSTLPKLSRTTCRIASWWMHTSDPCYTVVLYRTNDLHLQLARILHNAATKLQQRSISRVWFRFLRLTNWQSLLFHCINYIFSLYYRYLIVDATVHNESGHIWMWRLSALDSWCNAESSRVDTRAVEK